MDVFFTVLCCVNMSLLFLNTEFIYSFLLGWAHSVVTHSIILIATQRFFNACIQLQSKHHLSNSLLCSNKSTAGAATLTSSCHSYP